ncbi:MAG: PAS domain S-box protein [Gammaproteobacteria bacterium]|nr:PAS domain S-box protein [Gammaproteobacteria bacterium]
MRNNGTVTQKEYRLEAGTTIVSRTDMHGNILEANEAFIEASGFEWKDLVGQPHNMLRHPDVPEAVFKDFWKTLKAGKPWTQVVKNRRQNGDHYWVVANATPIYEKGHVSGYMSVRTPATPNQINAAEQAYAEIKAGKMKLVNGNVQTWTDKINLLHRFDTTSITTVLAVMLLVSAITPALFEPILAYVPKVVFEITDVTLVLLIIMVNRFSAAQTKRLSQYITSIASGSYTNEINSKGSASFPKIFGYLQGLQIKLGANLEDAKTALNNAKRIESALNSSSSSIMVADQHRSIIFINDALKDLIQEIEPSLQQAFPEFKANELLRENIDIFQKAPVEQAERLINLMTTHKERMTVGSRVVELVIDPILDQDKNRLGTVIEWRDLTEQLAIEVSIEKIVADASTGILSGKIETMGLTGFAKTLSESINLLLKSFSDTTNKLTHILSGMSDGNMTERMGGQYQGELLAMKTAVNNALNNIEITLGQVKIGASAIGGMSSEVSIASDDLSQRTQQQAASLEETAASMEELTSTVQQSTENTDQANILAHTAANEAQEGIQVMSKTIDAMQGITELSKQIGDITNVIDSIAFQTNLLALNAAVEAARAGEHGRGFAVVAGEVRNLAQKSADAAKDISTLISSTTQQIQSGTELVEQTNTVFEGMVEKIKDVELLVSEIASTSHEQTKGLDQINGAVSHLDQMTQQNAALVEQLSATAGNMSEEAAQQAKFVGRFTISAAAQESQGNGAHNIDFADAKMKHHSWNSKLDQLLAGQESDIDSQTARLADICPLGQWLHGTGQAFNQQDSFKQLLNMHAEFHATVGKVIDAHSIGDIELAHKEKEKVEKLSQEVIHLIDDVSNEVAKESADHAAAKLAPAIDMIPATRPIATVAPTKISAPVAAAPKQLANNTSEEWSDF